MSDIESQTVPKQHVHTIKKEEAVTKLLHDTSAPLPANGRIQSYLVDALQDRRNGCLQVWCLVYQLDGKAASKWLLLASMMSLLAGMIVGFVASDWNWGLGVGTAVLAAFTALQCVIVMRNW